MSGRLVLPATHTPLMKQSSRCCIIVNAQLQLYSVNGFQPASLSPEIAIMTQIYIYTTRIRTIKRS